MTPYFFSQFTSPLPESGPARDVHARGAILSPG
nr:MAG TPA: hypothetical protein [Caudoviricetes sp.]